METSEHGAPPRRMAGSRPPRGRLILQRVLIALLAVGVLMAAAVLYLHGRFVGGNIFSSLFQMPGTVRTLMDPRTQFPARDRINVLCVGLDRNIFTTRNPKLKHLNGMPYTKGARSDVLMVVSLDLANQRVGIYSIPRDTRVLLPRRRNYSKINEAHAAGGVDLTKETVEEFLGIPIDYHVVIKQEAVSSIVDALGGLELDVAKDMNYDDDWGQLHIHLQEGRRILNGSQVVGFMRFRHDAEGDLGRIRRQQQVIQTLAARAKDPSVVLKADGVITAIREHVETNLRPEQQLALAHLFHRLDTASVQAISMPIADTAKIGGVDYIIRDEWKSEGAVKWLFYGDKEGLNRLITVKLLNQSGSRRTYQRVAKLLAHHGFELVRAGRADGDPLPSTRVIQNSKLRGAARRVLEALGLSGDVEREDGDRRDVTIYLGKDLVDRPDIVAVDDWPDPPARPRTLVDRSDRPRRRDSEEPAEEAIEVRISPGAEGDPTTPESTGDAPGADSGDATAPADKPAEPAQPPPPTESSTGQ